MGKGVRLDDVWVFFIAFVSDSVGGSIATSVIGNLEGLGAKSLTGFVFALDGSSPTESLTSFSFAFSTTVGVVTTPVGSAFLAVILFLAAFITAIT